MSTGTERIVISKARAIVIESRYIVAGKLKVIPAKRTNKLVVFDWLARRFTEGERYTEAAVNRALSEAHGDVATLRRGMYDEYFLDRRDGIYWRTPSAQKLTVVDEAGVPAP